MMATQLAERRESPLTVFRSTLAQPAFREQLKMALPSHIPVERFERVSLTAVQNNPDLLEKVDRHSLFGALVKAAQDGLLPDGREGAIIPFKGRAQWMPMVAGIMKKVRNSGEIASWDAFAVYEKDEFERLLGDDQRIYHKPYEAGDPGQVVGAYSIVTFKDGTRSKDYMPRWRIEKAREQNPIGKNSLMWTKFYDEGAIKTVIRHHSKRLPMATDIDGIFERDDTMQPARGGAPQAIENAPAPEPVTRLEALEGYIEAHDPEPEVEDEPAEDHREGRATRDMGEGFSDDAALSEEPEGYVPPEAEQPAWVGKVAEIKAGIRSAKNKAGLTAVEKEFVRHAAVLPGEVQSEIDALLMARKRELTAAEF